jgi:tRNA threonylcarbamoyladenosine modification (KEOPS) complex  Pcc1 subunit
MSSKSSIVSGKSTVEFHFETEEEAQVLYDALLPETESVPSERADTSLLISGTVLRVEVSARDLTALRAAMNSFLSWISACKRTLDSVR